MDILETNFWQPALGAVIGFLLAQFVNLIAALRDWWKKPRLKIERAHKDGYLILSHSTQQNNHEVLEEKYFGFVVRNSGRSVALNVRFQITKVEKRDKEGSAYSLISDNAFDLRTYTNADGEGSNSVTIIPNTTTLVALAYWREDSDCLKPLANYIPDYYQESCEDAVDYRFNVTAFADDVDYVTHTIEVSPVSIGPRG